LCLVEYLLPGIVSRRLTALYHYVQLFSTKRNILVYILYNCTVEVANRTHIAQVCFLLFQVIFTFFVLYVHILRCFFVMRLFVVVDIFCDL